MKIRFFLLLFMAVFAAPAFAAADMFLELDGIPGESTSEAHPRTIRIESFSIGVSLTPGTTAGAKPTFRDISFSKSIDKTSPVLYLNCASGKHLKSATLYVRNSGERAFDFYIIKLSDVVVTSVQTSGAGDLPMESFSLNYTKIEFHYIPQNVSGGPDTANTVKTGWDLAGNVPINP